MAQQESLNLVIVIVALDILLTTNFRSLVGMDST